MEYSEALRLAENIFARLAPHCEHDRCIIAGSLRRTKREVGDIEIVAQPKITILKDIFDWDEGQIVDLKFSKTVESLGKIIKGKTDGRMMQIELPHKGMMLDLFMPQSEDFFRQLAIRTGSREYSQNAIATGWRKQGWVGTSDGLRREEQSVETKRPGASSIWKCTVNNPTLPPKWESEKHFFEWLKVPYISPEKREI